MTKLHVAIASSFFAFSFACVEPPEPPPEPLPPTTQMERSPTNPVNASPPQPMPSPAPAPEMKPTGIASVFQSRFTKGGGGYRSGVAAMFGSKIGPPPDTCLDSYDGPCTTTVCTSMANDTNAPPSAGKIIFNLPTRVIQMLPEPAGTYPHLQYEEQLFQADDTITFAATGADFPTFVTDVAAPPELVMSYPKLDDVFQPEVIDQKKDYALHWSAFDEPSDPVIVTATFITTKEGGGTMLVCEAKWEAGYLTVPQWSLAKLGDITSSQKAGGTLSVSTSRRKTLKVKNEVIRVEVVSTNHSAVIDLVN